MLYFYAFSEQQKINSGFFLFEAQMKAKKAKKDITGKRCMHKLKQSDTNVEGKDMNVVNKMMNLPLQMRVQRVKKTLCCCL